MKLIIFQIFMLFILIEIVYMTSKVHIPDEIKTHAKKIHNKCIEKTGVSNETLMQARSAKIPNERNMQCYLYCLFDTVGLISPEHVVQFENLLEVLPEHLHSTVKMLVDKCGTQRGADGCETAYLTVQCYADADPELFKQTFALD